ncbi:hypothetical protein LCGC14_1982220 [marine sediment metagenome]|uniref:Phage protein n=1 Tax=marine sediment metagenome TaxID=412755 RepID=A0A0F9I5L6_9ZZZZ
MMKYRKKPIVIEAIQWHGKNRVEVAKFVKGETLKYTDALLLPSNYMFIKTLEGTMRADIDDWIIKGVEDEYYPCKPSVFEATYDPVE